MEQQKAAHVALLVTPGMGHLIPVIEFAKRLNLLENNKFTCTLIIPTSGPLSKAEKVFLESLPDGVDFIALPPVNVDDLQGVEDVKMETRIVLTVRRSLPELRDVLRSLMGTQRLVALVVDLFGTDAFDIAIEFNIPPYIFYPSNALNLSIFLHMQELDQKVSCEYKDLTTPIEIPGCITICGRDLMDSLQDRKNDAYKWTLHVARTLSYDQITELAMGLELSEQRFLWVIRGPNNVANATYFGLQNQEPKTFLPEGFLDRVKGRGLVVSDWAPQAQILSHGSTGGFLTHCGWNSTLESVVNGIPLIAWPLYAEQRANAVILCQELKVALRPKVSKDGLVKTVDIANIVKNLMEGEEGKQVRNRMKDFKVGSERVLSPDGSSAKALADLALLWTSKITM